MHRMIHRFAGLLFAGVCVAMLLAGTAAAQPAATLRPGVDSLDLDPHVRFAVDTGGHATADTMFGRDDAFEALPAGGPTFGFQTGAYWFRADVVNRNQVDQYWLLLQEYSLSDFVDLYVRYPDGRVEHQASGDMRPFRERAIRYRQPNFRIHLPVGEPVQLLMRVRSESSMQVPLSLHTPKAFAELARDAQFGMGIYYGILVALLVYNLVLWLWLRDQSYFWYLFHVGGFGLVLFCLNGFGFEDRKSTRLNSSHLVI